MRDSNTMQFVGLDVHKDSIVVAVAEAGRESARMVLKIPFELLLAMKGIGLVTAVTIRAEIGRSPISLLTRRRS